jgi:DNA-binding MarR family transcriptional regulator
MIKSCSVLLTALNVFKDEVGEGSSDMSLQSVMAFLATACAPETQQGKLEKVLGLSQPAVSRTVTKLGEGRPDEPGYGLVESYPDAYDRRSKLVRPTRRGMELVLALETKLGRYLKRV